MCLDSPLKEGAKAKIETFKFQFVVLFDLEFDFVFRV